MGFRQTSIMKFSVKKPTAKSRSLFLRKAPSLMFERVLNDAPHMFDKNIFTLILNSISTNTDYSMEKKTRIKKQEKCFNHIVLQPQNRENRVPFFSHDILISSNQFLSLIGETSTLPHFYYV